MNRWGREIIVLPVARAVLGAALVLSSSAAFGSPYQFTPTLADYNAQVEVGFGYEKDENTTNGKGVKTKDATAVERVRLNTLGYIYHPRFILFNLGGALGLQQEDFQSNVIKSQDGARSSDEYDLRAMILPEHPYNLELFTLRRNPLIRPRFSLGRIVVNEKGATFRYKQKPLMVSMSAIEETRTGATTVDTRTYQGYIGYSLGPFYNTVGHDRSQATNSFLMQTTRSNSFFSNDLALPSLTLASRISADRTTLEDFRSPTVNDKTVTWTEQFSAELPWNLSSGATYNLFKETRSSDQALFLRDVLSTKSESAGVSLSHRLYSSLRTSGTVNYLSTHTNGGESRTVSESVASAYTKKIPEGRLNAGVGFTTLDTQTVGAPLALNEQHLVTYPTSTTPDNFKLNSQSVDQATIRVSVDDPVSGALVPLTPANYTIQTIGTFTQINVPQSLLPSSLSSFSGILTFHVSYSLLRSNVEFRTDIINSNISFELFNGLLNPYYSRTSSIQEVLAGSLPGGPDSLRMDTIGVIVQKKPFTLQTDYTTVSSRLNPYRTWKTVFEYREFLAETTTFIARLEREHNQYPKATAAPGTTGYTEEVTTIDLSMRQDFPSKNLDLFLKGTYQWRTSYATSTAATFNTALAWSLGKLSLNLGAAVTDLTTTFSTGKQKYLTEYYYLTASRKLF